MQETVLRRSSVFNNTTTYGNYVCRLQKVCFFLRQSTAWLAQAVRHVAKGMKKSQGRSFRFSNFIRSQLLVKLIEFETPSSEFAQAAFLSFLFAFRAPSETLQLRRAYSTDELLVFAPQQDPAIIGVQVVDGGPFLVVKNPALKMSYRKNITGGCIMRRPCFCGLASRKARQLCPIHLFWAIIRCRVGCGALLFQSANRRNFNRILKIVSARTNVPEAHRYSSHGFRRGASQELKESAPHWSAVVSLSEPGIPPAFRGYLDMSRDVELGARHLFDVDLESRSEAEEA